MGVPGLWKSLSSSLKRTSLLEFALKKGTTEKKRNLRIGIDAALWFFHAKAAGYGENFELQLFFHRCCRLLSMPVDVLFVFDGPGKPQFKRGQQVKTDENVLTDGVRALAEAFGFDTIVAPGEAEAALAQLNSLGIIDAVLTNDVDALIFGATTILRDSRLNTGQRYADILDIYTSHTYQDSGLTRSELVLVAILSGCDYTPGIKGCGITTATYLARCGLGEELARIYHSASDPTVIRAQLDLWRSKVISELCSPSDSKQKKAVAVSMQIPKEFPDIDTLRLFLEPERFDESFIWDELRPALWRRKANLSNITKTAEMYFKWAGQENILSKFEKLVWPGLVLRMFVEDAKCEQKNQSLQSLHPDFNFTIKSTYTLNGINFCKVGYIAEQFRITTEKNLGGIRMIHTDTVSSHLHQGTSTLAVSRTIPTSSSSDLKGNTRILYISIPTEVLQLAVPDLIKKQCTNKRATSSAHSESVIVISSDSDTDAIISISSDSET